MSTSFTETGVQLTLKEHLDSAWLTAAQLPDKDWAPADLPVVEKIISGTQIS